MKNYDEMADRVLHKIKQKRQHRAKVLRSITTVSCFVFAFILVSMPILKTKNESSAELIDNKNVINMDSGITKEEENHLDYDFIFEGNRYQQIESEMSFQCQDLLGKPSEMEGFTSYADYSEMSLYRAEENNDVLIGVFPDGTTIYFEKAE